MKSLKYSIVFVCIIHVLNVKADSEAPFNIELPDSVMSISDPDSLSPFLQSENINDRIYGIIRLGDIGNEGTINYLIELFENEPTSGASENIKYHSLKSLGKIGGAIAEDYLLDTASSLSERINDSTQVFSYQDSVASLLGAYEGLYYINSSAARDLIASIYENESLYWFVRSFAYEDVLKFSLKAQEFQTSADSISYLIDGLMEIGPNVGLIGEDGEINEGYLRRGPIVTLLYNSYESSLPILIQVISELPPGDPMLPEFEKIRTMMENNPPIPGN